MITELKKKVSAFKQNLGGFTTNRKIVVIESDDWGSVRMPNKEAYKTLIEKGIPVNLCPFLKYDGFENADDFECLSQTIKSIEDNYGKRPKITANYIMSNPDFESIRQSDFSSYHYISLDQKIENEVGMQNYKDIVLNAQSEKYFHPQLHGREHVNVPLWLQFLKANSKETHIAFDQKVYGVSTTITTEKRRSFLPALDYDSENEFNEFTRISLLEGQKLFKDFFDYDSRSFIAPNYTWDDSVESVLNEMGVKYIQSSRNQCVSKGGQINGVKFRKHKIGEANEQNQLYIVRNVIFEPATVSNKEMCLQDCYNQISMAFLTRKPAVISMHRLNFMGSLVEQNRMDNLKLFEKLITKLLLKWPDIEFMTTDELGDLIKKNKND
jgi:hypothetical protein